MECQGIINGTQVAFKHQTDKICSELEEKLLCLQQEMEATDSDTLGTIEVLASMSDEVNQVAAHLQKVGIAPQAQPSERI